MPSLLAVCILASTCSAIPLPLSSSRSNYCKFEDWVIPIFDAMLKEQQEQGVLWTPSKVRGEVGRWVAVGKHMWDGRLPLTVAESASNTRQRAEPGHTHHESATAVHGTPAARDGAQRLSGLCSLPARADDCAARPGNQPPRLHLLLGLEERHPSVLPRAHRWV